jgi:hypothetical protein
MQSQIDAMVVQAWGRVKEACAEFDRKLEEVDAIKERITPVDQRGNMTLEEMDALILVQDECLAAQDEAISAGRHRREMMEQLVRIAAYSASLRGGSSCAGYVK